jgi:hypothetical protein
LSVINNVRGMGYLFVEFLDFGEGFDDGIFIVDVFGIDFKGTSATLELVRIQWVRTLKMKLTISVMAAVSSSSYRSIHSRTVGSNATFSSNKASTIR